MDEAAKTEPVVIAAPTPASTEPVKAAEPVAAPAPAEPAPAGYVHPEAPEGFPTPGHKMAAEQAEEPVNHLNEIAALALQIKKASPAGCETISDQILQHVSALMSVG